MLQIRNLEVVYGGAVRALHGVCMDVPTGAVVTVLGANGAGKTTLLRAVSGLLPFHHGRVTRGSVTLDGQDLRRWSPRRIVRAGVAQVLEGRRLFAEFSVRDNLLVGAHTLREDPARHLGRVFDLFPVLQERRAERAGYLSGGEQTMLAIGRALMSGPRLLLLDEPGLGLAPRLVAQVGELITSLNAAGTTVLLVEQHTAMALRVASHGYVLDSGQVVADQPAERLRAGDEPTRAAYLGGPAPSGAAGHADPA